MLLLNNFVTHERTKLITVIKPTVLKGIIVLICVLKYFVIYNNMETIITPLHTTYMAVTTKEELNKRIDVYCSTITQQAPTKCTLLKKEVAPIAISIGAYAITVKKLDISIILKYNPDIWYCAPYKNSITS